LERELGLDQAHGQAQLLGSVDRNHRADVLILEIEAKKITLGQITTHHKLIPLAVKTGILDVVDILIGSKPGNLGIGLL
jgi:hypothetical protein